MFLLFFISTATFLLFLAIFFLWYSHFLGAPLKVARVRDNPVLKPIPTNWWESQAVFNPAAVYEDGRVHLLYRAMGQDGISRIGYASSPDGVHFDERLPYPVFTPTRDFGIPRAPNTYAPLSYDTYTNASGGGWGGSEDPRIVVIDGHLYMTFVAFDGWGFVRMALTSLSVEQFKNKQWVWKRPVLLSPPNEINKNWILFPEKINGKFAILHSVSPDIKIAYFDSIDEFDGTKFIKGSTRSGGRPGHWDSVVRGAGAPPLKTKWGWILLYHGFDEHHPEIGYKVGAMLLDLENPTRVLYRSNEPILEATEWYENDWKPGVTYASGAVIVGENIFIYYGGGDKYIATAKSNLEEFVQKLMHHQHAYLEPARM